MADGVSFAGYQYCDFSILPTVTIILGVGNLGRTLPIRYFISYKFGIKFRILNDIFSQSISHKVHITNSNTILQALESESINTTCDIQFHDKFIDSFLFGRKSPHQPIVPVHFSFRTLECLINCDVGQL